MRETRRLWRRRILVIAALVCACLVGIGVMLAGRQYSVGIASAQGLVDTTRSQLADLGLQAGSDPLTLGARASLLASLMTSSPVTRDVAHRVGIPPNQLIATQPATADAPLSPVPSVPDASISASNPRANILHVSVPTVPAGQLPIIQVDAQAPTPSSAANLSDAAFAALKAKVRSLAASSGVPLGQRVVIRQLGPASATVVARGTSPLLALVAAVAVFALACGLISGLPRLAAAWRRAGASEDGGSSSALPPEPEDAPAAAAEKANRLRLSPAPRMSSGAPGLQSTETAHPSGGNGASGAAPVLPVPTWEEVGGSPWATDNEPDINDAPPIRRPNPGAGPQGARSRARDHP